MKRLFGLIFFLCVAAVAVAEVATGGTAILWLKTFGYGGLTIANAPVTLSTQKIVFLTSLKEEYDKIENWMLEAEDLSAFVEQGQTLRFPEAGADPAVYKNRVTDVDSVEPTETTHDVQLDVYDSQNYKIRNIHLHALPFNKVQHYTRKSADAIVKKEIADAAYAFAPATAGNKRIVIATSGPIVGGYKSMRLEDIVALAMACDNAEFPDGRNLVLPSDLWWQLVNNNEILKGQLKYMQQNGIIEPKVVDYYGFKIHKSLGDKLGLGWDVLQSQKAAQGAAHVGDIVPAALLFCKNQVFRAGGNMEMFYQDKSTNPGGRAYEFGFQHRFKADFQMSSQRYSGLIYSALDPAGGSVVVDTLAIAMLQLIEGTNLTNAISGAGSNVVTLTNQYPDAVDDLLTDYLLDHLIEFSEETPVILTVAVTKGGSAIGTTTTIAAGTTSIYLSEILKALVSTTAVRESITEAEGDSDVYAITITPTGDVFAGDITVKTQVSKNAVSFADARTLATTQVTLDIDLS